MTLIASIEIKSGTIFYLAMFINTLFITGVLLCAMMFSVYFFLNGKKRLIGFLNSPNYSLYLN